MEKNIKRNKNMRTVKKGYRKHALVVGNQRIRHNYTWLAGFIVVILMIIIYTAVSGSSKKLERKNAEYDKQIVALESQLANEEQRKAQLEERATYITTKQFIIEFARDKLGLVFKDELIFRPEDK